MKVINWIGRFLIGVMLLLGSLCHAQQNATGRQNFGSFSGGPDIINVGNLNVHLDVPVLHRQGRGIPFVFDLTYDSASVWTPVTNGSSTTWQLQTGWGWSPTYSAVGYIPGAISFSFTVTCKYKPPLHTYITTTNYAYSGYVDIHGTLHHAPGLSTIKYTGDPSCGGGTGANGLATTDDGSGYTISIPWNGSTATVTSKGGANLSVPIGGGMATWAEDANGNEITVNTSTGQFFDTLSSAAPALTVTGTSPVNYTYAGPSGNVSVVVSYKTYPVQTHFLCSSVTDYGASSPINNNLVDKITYPDGSYYQFTYEPTTTGSGNVTGRIASVKLPTGGTISYAYTGSNGGINCADGSTMGFNRTTPDSTTPWKYVRSGSNPNWTTTVTDPLNYVTTYNLYQLTSTTSSGSASLKTYTYYETNRTATGETVLTCYNGNYANCASAAVSLPISQVDTYRTLGSSTSAVETKYDTTNGGRVTDVKEYDFGVSTGSAPPSTLLLRETTISYAGLSGIMDHPYQITVKDGGGNTKSQTTYAYDETGVTSTSAPQHTSPPNGSRGNPTTLTLLTSGTSTLKKTFTYFDTGNVNVATDVNAAQTTYHYGACGYSFPTEVDLPLSLTEHFSYDNNNTCVGAVMASATDVNGNVTSYKYTDPNHWRTTEIDNPDGGKTTIAYSTGAATPWTISNTTTVDSSQSNTRTTWIDGLGRPNFSQINDPDSYSGFNYSSITFDARGQVSEVFNPYFTTTDSTYGHATYAYDALGRTTSINDAAGFNTYFTYTGRATKVQYYPAYFDKQTIYQSDGLGRTVLVCEVTSTTQQGSPQNPTTCNTDITGYTGFSTTYQYDVLNNITQVTHPNGAVRTYQYDGLSRLTSALDPEVGTTSGYYAYTYTYDNQSAIGDLYQRTGPSPNQTGACPPTCVTSTYLHDALHRLTSVQYNDGTTPWKTFAYDQSSNWGSALHNGKGRLTGAFTCASGTYGTTCGTSAPSSVGEIFSYDTMGRVGWDEQCTPSICGTSAYSLSYSYDYAGDMLTAGDGTGINYTNSYNSLGQLRQITTNWLSPTQSGTVVSGITYNAFGELASDVLGNNITETWTYSLDGLAASYSTSPQVYTYSGVSWVGDRLYNSGDSVNGNWTYNYDSFGRISASNCSSGCPQGDSSTSYTYAYDAQGNRWQQNWTGTTGTGYNSLHTFGQWNHINDATVAYDSAGEITSDITHTYTYDPEGHLIKVDGGSTATYAYDAFGRRVSQQNSSGTFEYLFDLQNHPIAKVLPSGGGRVTGEVWFGRHWASNFGSAVNFMHSDWLGTGRVWTNLSGSASQYCQNLLFGDGLYCWSTNYSDNFSGLTFNFDDFIYDSQTRQLNPYNGRWIVPDPAGLGAVDLTNPQTWNRYAYVGNNPTSYRDPLGLVRTPNASDYFGGGGGGFNCTQDGVDQSCATVYSVLQGGGAVQCPNNDCGIGTAAPFRCLDVVCGYMTNEYAATHANELNGVLLTNSQYAKYLQGIMEGQRGAIVDQLTQTLCAPGDSSCAATINNEVTLNTSVGKDGLAGGNYNFLLGTDIQAALDLSGCFDLRCGGFDSLHFAYPGTVHLDTANPWAYWGVGAIVHGFVDVFLGNTIWAGGIPR